MFRAANLAASRETGEPANCHSVIDYGSDVYEAITTDLPTMDFGPRTNVYRVLNNRVIFHRRGLSNSRPQQRITLPSNPA